MMSPLSRIIHFVRVSACLAVTLGFCVTLLVAQATGLRERITENHFKFIPSGEGPFPTLIAIPGCSGIAFKDSTREATHPDLTTDDRLFRMHYLRMAERFRKEGFAVLLIDIYSAEGLVTACKSKIQAERIADYISESVAWVAELDFVDATRIHIIGWSMGGGGVLSWLHGPRTQTDSVQSAIAVYPSCKNLEPLTNAVPLLLLLGEADDIADPAKCQELIAKSITKPMITVRSFPGARHGFDNSDAPLVMDIGNGKSIGFQSTAAEVSWLEILAFLSDRR